MQRRRFKQLPPLNQRLAEQCERLRKEAAVASGLEREQLIRLARQAETAAHINEWLGSPGLRAPI